MFRSPAEYAFIVSSLGFRRPALHLLKKICYVEHVYHLTAPIKRLRFPRLRSDIHFEHAREEDFAEMLRGLAALDDLSRTEVVARILFYRHGFSSCYVGRNDRGDIVSMQWLIRPADNALLEQYLHRRRRLLNDSEVMIENIFIFPEFRRLGFFPSINHKLISVAQQEGFQACSAYVSKDNIASLNSYVGLGFRIENLMTGYNVAGQFWGVEDPR